MDSYIVINGKKTELTKEQLKQLGIKIKKSNPFERAPEKGKYFFINAWGDTLAATEDNHVSDDTIFDMANYCTDRKIMEQRALHEILSRRLWRLACENGELENPWGINHTHFFIKYNPETKEFKVYEQVCWKSAETAFSSREIADRAIEEIIKPFMEEHPEFVW